MNAEPRTEKPAKEQAVPAIQHREWVYEALCHGWTVHSKIEKMGLRDVSEELKETLRLLNNFLALNPKEPINQ